jgi:Lon protease-like protein
LSRRDCDGRPVSGLSLGPITLGPVEEIGLFPLGMVLLPGEHVPLHIFEERYKELIGECLEAGREFGLVLSDQAGTRAIGTTAAVTEVLDRFPDGRMNILVEGRRRFRIGEMTSGRTFDTALMEELPDQPEGNEPAETDVAECLRVFRKVLEAAGAEVEGLDLTADSLAFEIAGHIELGHAVKQELLEMRSERERVLRLTEWLDQAVDQVRLQRRARELASGNGHVTKAQ